MARVTPSLPHPSAKVVDPDDHLMREWRDMLAAVIDRLPRFGSALLSGGAVAVTLTPNENDTNYRVFFEITANETLRVSSKAVTGFTITSSNSFSASTVGYAILRF